MPHVFPRLRFMAGVAQVPGVVVRIGAAFVKRDDMIDLSGYGCFAFVAAIFAQPIGSLQPTLAYLYALPTFNTSVSVALAIPEWRLRHRIFTLARSRLRLGPYNAGQSLVFLSWGARAGPKPDLPPEWSTYRRTHQKRNDPYVGIFSHDY